MGAARQHTWGLQQHPYMRLAYMCIYSCSSCCCRQQQHHHQQQQQAPHLRGSSSLKAAASASWGRSERQYWPGSAPSADSPGAARCSEQVGSWENSASRLRATGGSGVCGWACAAAEVVVVALMCASGACDQGCGSGLAGDGWRDEMHRCAGLAGAVARGRRQVEAVGQRGEGLGQRVT